ncbi:hypothetical protein [Halorubrum salsamenti]|uniref:hypothetical protein n=1 Tax=Halorubrum salsamenti TaxID=2583990 RepID=UPI0011A48C4D|nr:hypothetical protein [Halorubrum salsamenti]
MYIIPSYLRAITELNNGLESFPDDRAAGVDEIVCESAALDFKQQDEVPMWRYEEALQGKTEIKHGRKVKTPYEVDHPDRHWWISSNGLLENIDPPLREHADIFNLLLSINLCMDVPVSFSQSPGQIRGGASQLRDGAIDTFTDLSRGSTPLAIATMGEIPQTAHVSADLEQVYEMVRSFRSNPIGSDEDMDIRIALHMYEDALTSSIWTLWSNLFFVCEKVLCSGRRTKPAARIVEVTDMDDEQAQNWKEIVNRIKHPDKGNVSGFLEQQEIEVPSPWYARQTANTVLKHSMRERFENFSE